MDHKRYLDNLLVEYLATLPEKPSFVLWSKIATWHRDRLLRDAAWYLVTWVLIVAGACVVIELVHRGIIP